MPKLSVNLITWNGEKYIPYLFASLRNQTFKDWELLVIDNGSSDGTAAKIEAELASFSVSAKFIKNNKNLGFAGGHNQGLRVTGGELVLFLNQDIILAPDYFEKIVGFMETRPDAAAAQGVLCKWIFPDGKTDIVDSLGLRVFKNRRVVDITESDGVAEVFGLSGALPMFRRSALLAIKINDEIFDEDFFAYKEDVDLTYRLRLSGFKSFITDETNAWHDRTAAADRGRKSDFVNYHSYKNHLFVLIKNEFCANFWVDFPRIFWYEFRKFVYILLFERRTLRALPDFFRLLPKMVKKRKIIKAQRKISAREMRKWFV